MKRKSFGIELVEKTDKQECIPLNKMEILLQGLTNALTTSRVVNNLY
jgi:hypothetical protein